MKYYFLLTLGFFVASCSTYSESNMESFDRKIENYIDSTGTEMTRVENGLYYNIIEQGAEENIKITDRVTFHYTGAFLDGEVFQTIPKEEALTFYVRELIVGWQDALTLIGNGGEIEVIIPPHLGYGKKKTELIPPNSILKYRLKVIDVE
jgi:FKBP-type peptidyl-prolyl cis-trans isomerase FkpA